MAIYKDEVPTKDGRAYFFRTYKRDIYGNNHQYESKRYKNKKEAEDAERKFLMKQESFYKNKFTLVADLYFEEMYKKRKESTIYCYEGIYNKNIKPYFERFSIESINIQHIKEWHAELDKTALSVNYKNKLNTILKGIFNYAIKEFGLVNNPAEIVGCFEKNGEEIIKEEELKYITLDEFKKFISVIEEPLWHAFFTFLYYTGMRKGEIQALSWTDIDMVDKVITVNKTLTTKTKNGLGYKLTSTKNCKNRKIKMNKALYDEMVTYKEYIKKDPLFKESWFIFGNQRFLPHKNIDRYKTKYFALAGMSDKEITIHQFRHSCISLLASEYMKKCNELKVPLDTEKFFTLMADRNGHTVAEMRKTYLHLFPETQDEIVDLFDSIC